MNCPRCQADVAPGDRFCADCGARIAAPEPAGNGGRVESAGPGLAGRTDPGLVHRTNQDAFALSGPAEGGAGSIVVVCDGVSNSQTPELAAATAAQVTHRALMEAAATGENAHARAMADAIRQAHAAVCALPFDRQAEVDAPATTLAAAWVHAAGVTLGWLGDSRAYALSDKGRLDGGGRMLTRDHSWLAMVTDRKQMTEAEARLDPRAHALVHCLGTTDFTAASSCPEPGVLDLEADGNRAGGWLLLCSDGLWNYAETAEAILGAAGEGINGDAADLCARLVAFARASGGHDNVTVVAVRCT